MSHALAVALRQIPPAQRVTSRDSAFVIGWYVARHDEDRYDETTEYRVALFDARTEEEITYVVTSVHERMDSGSQEGQYLVSAAFDPEDVWTVVLHFDDKSEQRCRWDDQYKALDVDVEELGVVMSDEEKEILAELRNDKVELARKIERKP